MRPLAKYRKSRMWHHVQKHKQNKEKKLSALRNEEYLPDQTSSEEDPFNSSKNKSGVYDKDNSKSRYQSDHHLPELKDTQRLSIKRDEIVAEGVKMQEGYLNDPTESNKSDSDTNQIWQKIAFKDSNNKIKGTKTLNHTDQNHFLQQLNYLKKHNLLGGLPLPMVNELARVPETSRFEQDIDS